MLKVSKKRKLLFCVITLVLLVFLAFLNFNKSFSNDVTSSAWDGVVATSFKSGNGTIENPYVISNASEFALFKELLESEDASDYLDKNYVITNGFNYGEYDISIDNNIPFSGVIDGTGSLIYNISINNSLFNELDGATIKNINFNDIKYTLNNETGALLANNITGSVIDMIVFSGNVTTATETSFGGLVYSSSDSEYNNIVLNVDINSDSEKIYNFAYELNSDEANNILIKGNDYENTNSETDITFNSFNDINSIDSLVNYATDSYSITVIDDNFVIQNIEENIIDADNTGEKKNNIISPSKATSRSIVTGDTITEHASGASGNTFYINDLTADKNYYTGLNYTEIRNTSIPGNSSTGYYDDSNLVKVQIIYDGADINVSSRVGAMSPINENTNKFVYFKYYPLERNSNGSLATNSDGDHYIRIELIDNPFSKRPYTTSGGTTTEYGFNGWVCNQDSDTTNGLCGNAIFSFRKDDYTRYLEVPVNGGSQIRIHLNASWYKANVVTSYNDIEDFDNMSMQNTYYTVSETVSHYGKAYWREDMVQMVFLRTYVRRDDADGYMPAGTWYKTNQNDTYYTYNTRRRRCSNNTTCYTYTTNTSGISADTEYTGGSVKVVLNYNSTDNNTETTINNFNWNYMYIVDNPAGPYSYTGPEDIPYSYFSNNDNVSGFYYKVSNPTSAMINTGEYYNYNGEVCTSASSCTTAYKLIQYNDSVTNSEGHSISTIELGVDSKVVDTNKYYYLVTRDMNIFRYTSATALSTSNLEVDRPYTITGTSLTGTSTSGVIVYQYTSGWLGGTTYYDFSVQNDLVIENIKIDGPDTTGSNNSQLGANSKTSRVIYANSNNLKIGRNVTSSDGNNYLTGEAVFGGANSSNVSGTFRVIIESGIFYAYHSGVMSGSSNYTLNETTIFGNDYDRITSNNNKLKFLIGLDGYAGGHNTAGSDSMFASFNIVKSGTFGYNSDGTPNNDNTAGMYIGGRASQCVESPTGAKIEGGNINIIVGGYGYNGSSTTNSTYIGMSGGTVRSIYGGAGHSTTKGNRIINVTGGTVSYSVLGGSDSYDSGDTNDGILQGSTLVYIGGNATIGGGTGTLQGVESGSVFGAGGGDTTSDQKGTVYNSHVIINGGNINTSVYGGGNYGSTGTQSSSSASTVIDVYSGTIGTIYGGSKSAGFSKSTYNTSSTIDINVMGGTITNIYGGSNTEGTIYGSVDIDITSGTITGNVYGGGQGSPTEVTNDVDITIGDSSNGPTIGGNVYGGSALGSVNSQSLGSVDITVNKGTVTGSVFGGGEGSSSTSATVYGDITVSMTGGTVGNVYGGADTSGLASQDVSVSITGGTINTNVYGGGKGANTYVNGDVDVVIGTANVQNTPTINGSVYGGSAFGTVNSTSTSGPATGDTSVTVNNGVIVGSVFGGGQGNATYTPYVLGNIDVTINNGSITNVFGGNDQSGTHTAQNNIYLNGGTIASVYGGGNQSSVTTTHVYEQGSTVTSIYGGSNTLGDVTTSNVTISSGSVSNVYGGNNIGGLCGTTNVIVNGTATISSSVYGGGNQASTTTTNVTLTANGNTISNVYGGGNEASVGTTNITENGVSVTNMFGGSNSAGTVTTSNITYNGGTTTNVYGGNNEGGNTIDSYITLNSGTVTAMYGGGNEANGSTSTINIIDGNITNLFGGGNSAGLTTSTIIMTSGDIDNIYGGSNNAGSVTSTNITINGSTDTINAIYGGGNLAPAGSSNVVINTGTINALYGGGNAANMTGNTVVDVNGGSFTGSIYGGGNFGAVTGSSNVTLTNATILGSAYAGGNGSTATVMGNTTITVDGNTIIGTNSSTPPSSGSVFGGGNQAYTGVDGNEVVSTVNIIGGTIYGNVYGGANTSVIYGNTVVNIGKNTLNDYSTLHPSDIYIKGHIFGGGEANASGSEIYDWYFISVTDGVNINIDASGHTNFDIDGSFYGGGNASSSSGDSYLSIKNYGTFSNPKRNISIQRVTYVTIDNSNIGLEGAIDRANDYDRELFSLSRIDDLKLKNNSSLFLETGANLLKKFESLDANGVKASVTIDTDNNTITRSVDNRIYMYEGKNLNIAKDQQVTDYGEVVGMTFLGIFNYDINDNINKGIYDNTYDIGDTLDWAGVFNKGSYVLGLHNTNHDIEVDGFYSNFMNEDTEKNEVNYIDPTPDSSRFYMWYIGENVIEYNVNLVASKYSTLGSVEASFLEFSKPNTSFQVINFEGNDIASGISLVDKDSIARIASTETEANTKFGLTMEASNSGWLTNGRTSFYTSNPNIGGTTYYEGENSTVVPTMLFYLYHSKNITLEQNLGTARISVMAITKIDALTNEVKRLVINVNMSTALFQTVEYEGAMTPGDKYELFASTSTNITTHSKFSAYYALFSNSNIYRPGYHRALTSTIVFPENTKITMLDFIDGTPQYYYHIITSADVAAAEAEYRIEGECSYNLSMFTKMGSKSNNANYDDAAMNSIYYDGTSSNEEFNFIVDLSETNLNTDSLNNKLLIELRDSNDESIINVLGIQHSQLTYNLYSNSDSNINIDVDESLNPLYIGYNDVFDVVINYQNTSVSGVSVIDTQYFDSKLGLQIHLENSQGDTVSGTALTGSYFTMNGVPYYPDINGITYIKLSDKVGNTEKWITFNTENSSLATGTYTFVFEAFGSSDGIYYSSGSPSYYNLNMPIINSTYGLNPIIDPDTVIFSASNDKNLKFTINYTSLLDNPNIRLSMYRREYDVIYDTDYELVDLASYVDSVLNPTNNTYEYLLIEDPEATNTFELEMKSELITGTYRLEFKLYDGNTKIGQIIRYIIIK